VTAFTTGQCRFDQIVPLVSAALAAFDDGDASTLDGVLAGDAWARDFVRTSTGRAIAAR
jgi:1-deoxy-D-xylulose 5-phosphate reductoisomerase